MLLLEDKPLRSLKLGISFFEEEQPVLFEPFSVGSTKLSYGFIPCLILGKP